MSHRDRPILTIRHKPDAFAPNAVAQTLMAGMASPFLSSERPSIADLLARSGTPTLGYGFAFPADAAAQNEGEKA